MVVKLCVRDKILFLITLTDSAAIRQKQINVFLPIRVILVHLKLTFRKNDLNILRDYIMFKPIDICYQTMIYRRIAFVCFRNKLIKREYGKKPFYPRKTNHSILCITRGKNHSTTIRMCNRNFHVPTLYTVCFVINKINSSTNHCFHIIHNDGLSDIEIFPQISCAITQCKIRQVLIDIDSAKLVDFLNAQSTHNGFLILLPNSFLNENCFLCSDLPSRCRKTNITLSVKGISV